LIAFGLLPRSSLWLTFLFCVLASANLSASQNGLNPPAPLADSKPAPLLPQQVSMMATDTFSPALNGSTLRPSLKDFRQLVSKLCVLFLRRTRPMR
jgi:hypothetical protein